MDRNSVYGRLSQLDKRKKLLFGAICSERIKHFYSYFENENKKYKIANSEYASLSFLDEILTKIYDYVTGVYFFDNEEIKKYLETFESITPDTDEISDAWIVLSQNAVISLAYCVDYINDNDAVFINYCSDKVIECIDTIVENGLSTKYSFNEEYEIQEQLLLKIAETDSLAVDAVKEIRQNFDRDKVLL